MKNKFYIYGAGINGRELLKRLGKENCIAFIDRDKRKQGTKIDGINCISLEEINNTRGGYNDIVLISVGKDGNVIRNQLNELHFTKVFCMDKWLREQKYFKPNIIDEGDYRYATPFNHYESPYPDIIEIHNNEKVLFDTDKEVLDIDFNIDGQLALYREMETIELIEWPAERDNISLYRYYYNNGMFLKGSADALYYMMRIVKPKRIIEIGSGYSTAVMLDTNETFFDNKIKIISIEPDAERLRSLLKLRDNLVIYEKKLQEMPTEFFEVLEEGDFLFIDSSHISNIGSDVNYLFFEIFPRLKKGVYIHFHDIFYPFIYPKKWIYQGIAYNEMYLLRAFLMNNQVYTIQLFGEMMTKSNDVCEKLKGCGAGSLWIKKNN